MQIFVKHISPAQNTVEQQPKLSNVQKQELHLPDVPSLRLLSGALLSYASECSCCGQK